MEATAKTQALPSLRRRLIALGAVLAVAVLLPLTALLMAGLRTHELIEDSRINIVPHILERQRATANLERLIRFGWIAATAATPQDWRQASVTAQALTFHPSLTFDTALRAQVMGVHGAIRQIIARRERAHDLRQTHPTQAQLQQAHALDLAARELWTQQEGLLVNLQGHLADDAARVMVDRFDQIASISDLTQQAAIAVAAFILVLLAGAALVIRGQLLQPVLRIAQSLRHTLDGAADPPPLPRPATAEMAVVQDAAVQLRDALRRSSLREQALHSSEQRLVSIFAASEAAILLTDIQGQVLQANAAFLRLLSRDDGSRLRLDDVTAEEDRVGEAALLRQLLAGDIDHYRLDKRFTRPDGSPVWVDASVRAIRDDAGRAHQLVVVAIDISERVRAEKELRFIRALVDQSADPIYCLDPLDDGRLVWVNAATCRHFGHDPEQMLAMRIPDWDPNFTPDTVHSLWPLTCQAKTRVFESTHRVASGEIIPVEISATWLIHDDRPFVAGYIRDIRARNHMLEVIARSNDDLQQFAYVASHDLQEPLRMVASFLQLLERRHGPQLDASAREYIQFAVDGAVRMKQLIEDLLAFSRVDSRGVALESVDLGKIAQAACDNLVTAIADSGGQIQQETALPMVQGDEAQLTRLLQNLIGNALKYRAGSRFPQIVLSARPQGDFWQICVRDNGIGIAPEYHDRIFMIFQRLHGIGTYEGTGIGLAICKRIVERHGGEIWVESQEEVGSSFFFTLPASDLYTKSSSGN